VLPLKEARRRSPAKTFRHAPDPRAGTPHYRIGPVLTLMRWHCWRARAT
jgi:hypothetical protein